MKADKEIRILAQLMICRTAINALKKQTPKKTKGKSVKVKALKEERRRVGE